MNERERKDITVVLHGQARQLAELVQRVKAQEQHSKPPSERQSGRDPNRKATESSKRGAGDAPLTCCEPVTWERLVARHEEGLRSQGVDRAELTLDALLSEETRARIEAAWNIWPAREQWRWWGDYVAVGSAGLLGGLLDLFLAGTMSAWPESGAKAHDDVLADASKEFKARFGNVSRDPMKRHVIDARIPSDLMGGNQQDLHRIAGCGHDVCRYREALQLMMGDAKDIWVQGVSVASKTRGLRLIGLKGDDALLMQTFEDPEQAAFALLAHWWADFFGSIRISHRRIGD